MIFLPYRWRYRFLLGLLLVDLPVIAVIGVVGLRYGYRDTAAAIGEWRLEHPWSFVPSAVLLVALLYRWRRS